MSYRLTVHKIDQSGLFDLTWGEGQRITATVAFPDTLLPLYDTWRRAYLGYYKQALRGRAGAMGQVVAAPVDWHSQLGQAEARLLSEFHRWLRQGDLFDLRQEIVRAAQAAKPTAPLELFLTCTPLDLARLPWETWEFGPPVQILRSPPTIRAEAVHRRTFRRGKTRVLAILGDETGLNFTEERNALAAQAAVMDILYVGWQPEEEVNALKQRIYGAIADPQGWDILFFAGHSNEAAWVGGEVAIAPNLALSIKDLTPALQQAQRRGLQFALFNSCSGLDIAQGLINLGLSQVAVMREPIHNQVAQTFLVQLLQHLSRGENVQEALRGACQFLKLAQNLTYPSAYLVPSLFRHPASVPYQLEPTGWRSRWRRWQPTRREALLVSTLAAISLIPAEANWVPQAWLMDQRVATQAIYRDLTGQIPPADPPVVLVQVDGESFIRWGATDYTPINRAMLAAIVAEISRRQAPVIGLDYILDLAQPAHDAELRQALEAAIGQSIWPVVATARQGGAWLTPHPHVMASDRLLLGNVRVPWWRMLPQRSAPHLQNPFSYQLAVAHRLHQRQTDPAAPRPSLDGPPLADQIAAYRQQEDLGLPRRATLHPITYASDVLWQQWLQPLIDFSLPPDQVFITIPAWQLWENAADLPDLTNAVVIVVPGGYHAAGLVAAGDDNMPIPPALVHWRRRANQPATHITGGEAHAYMVHHILNNRLVVPIPDLWLILVAAGLGKALSLHLAAHPRPPWQVGLGLGLATAGYGLLSLQLYISGAVLLPWLLPSLVAGCYGLSSLRGNTDATH